MTNPTFWHFEAHNQVEIETDDFFRIAKELGFRARFGVVFRIIGARIVPSSRSEYFAAMRGLITPETPRANEILDVFDYVQRSYGRSLVDGLPQLPASYIVANPNVTTSSANQ